MYAIRVVGPSGYEQYWNQENGKGFLTGAPFSSYGSEDEAEMFIRCIPKSVSFGRLVDIVNLEGE